mmetsp:Transcript_71716/g.154834  ORF Transcript_71716/g.154834 Transcript_71716/m.154834 type:complete len:420 (+) Transcript_71716:168-1427(+)
MRPSVIASPRPAAALNAIPEHRVLASPGRPRHIAPKEHVSTDYYLTGILAVGGRSSQVVRGIRKEDHEKVAIKSIRRDLLSRRDVTNMNHAIRIQAAIEHANVAELKEFYKSKTHVHLVMELLEGGTVLEHLRQRIMLSESRTKCVVEQTLRAAEHLHDQGIVHRDIKCQNLVYASDDRDVVKLIDFGLSAHWAPGDEPMTRGVGTQSYLAPEVREGAYTNKVDCWCVGIAAYALLTGELPSRRKHDMKPIFSERFFRCSVEAQNFVAGLLEMDPKRRTSASQALKHGWMRDAEDKATEKADCRLPSKGGRKTSRKGTQLDSVSTVVPTSELWATDPSSGPQEWKTYGSSTTEEVPPEKPQPADPRKSFWRCPVPSVLLRSKRRVSAFFATVRRTRTATQIVPLTAVVPVAPHHEDLLD